MKQPEPVKPQDGPEVTLDRFRAELEVFSGPLDLLLCLIKQEEVDIFEVSLSRITERYLAAVRTMEFFDVNVAAEFLVVAATLMEIKSRTLLPPAEVEEDEEDEDPGAELVRRLLEYKEFKEAAGHLGDRAREQGVKFPRGRGASDAAEPEEPADEALLEDLAVWDLMAAFAEVVEQTQLRSRTEIVRSSVPVSVYINEVLATLRAAGRPAEFVEFFEHGRSRARVIGIFLALLELARRKTIRVKERKKGGWHIEISLRDVA
ncbi:MAG: segregation and condensation protein A [Planctomycetota bacterium]|jgi:segregation and condensation protein A